MKTMLNLYTISLSILFFWALTGEVWGQTVTETSPLVYTLRTNTDCANSSARFTALVETGSSGAKSESNAHTVYIPLAMTGAGEATNNEKYLVLGSDHVPQVTDDNSTGSGDVCFSNLDLSDVGSGVHLHLAIKDDDDWKVVHSENTATTSSTFTLQVPIESFCDATILDCTNVLSNGTNENMSSTIDETYYIFASTTQAPSGSSVNLSDDTGTYPGLENGIYYNVNLSNRIVTSAITLDSLSKGDTLLISKFSDGSVPTDVRGVYAYAVRSNTEGGGCTLSDDTATVTHSDEDTNVTSAGLTTTNNVSRIDMDVTAASGVVTIPDLLNGFCYGVRLYYFDKYGFASKLSNRVTQTPELLETLLQTQQCYLLTAGFKGGHPVIEFFRHFRDTVLSEFYLGRAFIDFYYSTAPQYTGYIINSPALQSIIKSLATTLYYTLKFWQASLSFLFILVVGYSLRKLSLI